ncbi:KAP family P-loop NTPase fold protein [Vibrio cholerae]
MPSNVVINWSQPVDIDGAHYPKDTLDRQKYAQYLSNFLASKGYDDTREEGDRKRNYVLNLNSKWGSGKTYFLRRWKGDLKEHHPVVYVDAWQQDYSDDPLMAVISSMINQLREQAGKSAKDAKFKAPRKLLGLLKAAAPAVAGGLAKRYLGIDPVKIMESSEEGHIGETVKDEKGNEIDMGAAASKMVSHLIDEHSAKSEAIESLKHNIEQWVEAAKANKGGKDETIKQYPAFVFIDELDRCRPSYAVEMLETIKHIFNIKGVVFVVATDTEQLQHAVKAVYGEGFDAEVYLGRFFDARFTLREANYEQLLDVHCELNKISMSNMISQGLRVWPKCAETHDNDNDDVSAEVDIEKRNLSSILRAFDLTARQAIQVMERLTSTITNLPSGSAINLYYLLILMCIREKHSEFFTKLKSNNVFLGGAESSWNIFAHKLFLQNISLDIHIDTKTFFTQFKQSNGYTTINYDSQYSDADTVIPLSQFFVNVHGAMLSDFNRNNIESGLTSANRGSSGNGVGLTRKNSDMWLQYGCHWIEEECRSEDHSRSKGKIQLNQQSFYSRYKDLVELSTALNV